MLEAASGFRITAAKAEHHRQVEHPLGASVEVPLGKSLEVLEHLRRLGAVVEAGGVVDEQLQGLIVEAGCEQAVEGVGVFLAPEGKRRQLQAGDPALGSLS